jgi:GT2 family glycosyltransferase
MDSRPAAVDVTLIVVTFNSARTIARCLAGLQKSVVAHTAELLIVDNASTDDTTARAHATAPEAISIELKRNVGFARANNVALQRASGRCVALVNSDAFIDPGAVDRMLELMGSDPRIGIVGGRLRDQHGRPQPSAGRFPTLLGELGVALFLHRTPLLGRLPLSVFAHPAHYRKPNRVGWVTGAFCVARREVGPLPAQAFMYGEDVEWAWQARRRGFEVWLEPGATAIHLGSGGDLSPSTARFRQESRVRFVERWFSARGRSSQLAARLVLSLHALVRIGGFAVMLPLRRRQAISGIAEFAALLGAAAFGAPAEPCDRDDR